MFKKINSFLKNKKASEFVESLLTLPILITIVFSIAYGTIYYNAKNNIENVATYYTRTMTTAKEYCAYSRDNQGSLIYDDDKTKSGDYARNMILDSEMFNGTNARCYLALETYETKVDANNNSILEKVTYYDFFGFSASYNSIIAGIEPANIGPEKVADHWQIGNFINLNITSSIFSTTGGVTLFEMVTSINFFDGMYKVEVISSTATINVKFQIENDVCDDINLSDNEKPSVCTYDQEEDG